MERHRLDPVGFADAAELAAAWERVLEEELQLAQALVHTTAQEQQAALEEVQRARVTKRDLGPFLSAAERNIDANRFLEDLRKEADVLVPTVSLRAKERLLALENPLVLLDSWPKIRALIAGFMWTLLAGIAWWWARRRADRWALSVASRVRQARPELRMADVRALRDPTARAIRNVIDLLLGQVLLFSLGDALLEVQLVVRAYLYLAAYRALLAVFDLAVVPAGEVRPATVVLRADTFRLARRTMRAFLAYFVASRLLHWGLWDVLQLDTLAGLVDTALDGLFWLLVVFYLFRWEPPLRESLSRRRGARGAWYRWLLPARTVWLLRIPLAALQLVLLSGLFLLDTAQRFASEGSPLAWIFNALNRVRLTEPGRAEFRPIDEALRTGIIEGETPDQHRIHRDELAAVGHALEGWRSTGLRGLVAIVGDRGMGKHTACHEVEEMLVGGGLELRRARLPGPMRTEADLVSWLLATVGSDAPCATYDELAERLREVPPRGVILEGVHRTFARRVGGLDAVQALFYVLNATSDHHFYVVSVHGPAWDYFDARGSMVDCGVFHTVVRLQPLTSQQLRSLTLARAGGAGVRVDFSVLERQTTLAGEPGAEEDHAVTVFYRLLAEASGGNPTAAVHLFTRCLEPGPEPNVVRAHMAPALSVQPIAQLSDDAMFILVAIDLHDELELEELEEVTNLPLAVCRATVRDLVSRGPLIRDAHQHLLVPDRQRRAVQRTLRRRHFLHLGAET